jgi:signal transduction histidine kinase
MILEGSYGKVVERARIPMENVYKSNERLINLVNDLLSISRIESGKMEFKPEKASIEDVIDGVINDLKITAEKKKLYLKWEKPEPTIPHFLLDSDKMRQVILNLVDNAIKYTKKGGITIKCQMSDVKCQIVISDTGGGMTPDEIAKIFESFSRGTVGVKAYTEGAGLGLYIARKFVEMHGGKMWAESEGRDKGSAFNIELPVK